MPDEQYLSEQISHYAFERLIHFLRMNGTQLHCLSLYHGEEELIHFAMEPYSLSDRREIYSLSKIFTSTACGLCFDRGLLSPEDLVVSRFPEYRSLWEKDERFQHMKLRHLLTMSAGHDHCVMSEMSNAADSVQAFFEIPLSYEPGERFVYSTGATCMAAEYVRRVSGKTVPELLSQELFPALGIGDFFWESCHDGHCAGGSGLNLNCDEVAQLGRLYLGHGIYQGKRLLSDEWVCMATAMQMDNSFHSGTDFACGYGFQFWRLAGGGYRGDGAYGQLCMVLPEKQITLTMFAECIGDMQQELDAIHNFLSIMYAPNIIGASLIPLVYTSDDNWYPYSWSLAVSLLPNFDTGKRILRPNVCEIDSLRVVKNEKQVSVIFELRDGCTQILHAVSDDWTEGEILLKNFKPVIRELCSRREKQRIHYSALLCNTRNGCVIEVRTRNTPHELQLRFFEVNGKLQMKVLSPTNLMGDDVQLFEE